MEDIRRHFKNEDTWCEVFGDFVSRAQFNLESTREVVAQMTLHTFPTATRTCSTRTGTMTVNGSTPIGTIPTISGMTMGRSRFPFPQLSSFHTRASRRGCVLFRQLSIPPAEHLADFIERERKCCVLLRINRFGFPEDHQQHFHRIEFANGKSHPWLFLCLREKCC